MGLLPKMGVCSLAFLGVALVFGAGAKTDSHAKLLPKAGVKTAGVQIPIDSLKAEVEIPMETPGWITIADSVVIPNESKDAILRIDAKTNKPLEPLLQLKKPCSGAIVAFASIWAPSCGTQSLIRFDPKTGKTAATLATGAAELTMGLAATADSLWMLTDNKTTLSRIDPGQNQVVGELRLPAGCNSLTFGEGSLWVTCPSENHVLRVNPVTDLVEKRIDVSAMPRGVAFGNNSVWVLCEKDGKVERIDPKTNKVMKTIDLLVPNAGGSIAYGEGSLWVSQVGFPLTRIETATDKEKVAQQFWGDGGGFVSVGSGVIWLANVKKGSVWRLDPKRVLATLAE